MLHKGKLELPQDRAQSLLGILCREHKGDFEPFLEKRFSSYLSEMGRNGTWGDELTLVSAFCFFAL